MRILFLSPQPFFEERGTTIAIDLLLRSLSERGDEVDVLTFHVGEDRAYTNVSLTRIRPPFAPRSIKPCFSLQKVYCDFFLSIAAFRMLRRKRYDLVHAVEEASFVAMVLRWIFKVPYIFDMDSSMATQLLDQFKWMRPFGGLLFRLETLPMRQAIAVVPMCEDLAGQARRYSRGAVRVLKDISLVAESPDSEYEDLRSTLDIGGPLLMYVGNLEEYQGIDLLLETLSMLSENHPDAELVIIGGSDQDIDKYRDRAHGLGIGQKVHLVGPRPVAALGSYLKQADLLISPRTHGTNTPMKVYSYLDSGVPVVATALPTHTQVMTEKEAALTAPDPTPMSAAISRLLDDPAERDRIAQNAKALIQREHSWTAFRRTVDQIFGELEGRIYDPGTQIHN